MKLIVNTTAHGIKAGEYKGEALKQLLSKNRLGVTSLVSRGQAKWDHEDKKPEAEQTQATKADKPSA